MAEISGEKLLERRAVGLVFRLFSLREHEHVKDGDGAYHCLPEGARLICIYAAENNGADVDGLAFSLCEAGAMGAVLTMPASAVDRVFDVRSGDGDAAEDNLPF